MRVFEKCANFTVARDLRAAGLYPYFQRIERSADTNDAARAARAEWPVSVGRNRATTRGAAEDSVSLLPTLRGTEAPEPLHEIVELASSTPAGVITTRRGT